MRCSERKAVERLPAKRDTRLFELSQEPESCISRLKRSACEWISQIGSEESLATRSFQWKSIKMLLQADLHFNSGIPQLTGKRPESISTFGSRTCSAGFAALIEWRARWMNRRIMLMPPPCSISSFISQLLAPMAHADDDGALPSESESKRGRCTGNSCRRANDLEAAKASIH